MPIEIICSSCQAVLRVADEHAGKSARCPQCSAVVPIPLTPLPESAPGQSGWQGEPTHASQPVHHGQPPQPGHPSSPGTPNPFSTPKSGMAGGIGAGMNMGMEPHRGPLILILGIASLVCCMLFFAAIPAIIMANEDLRKMNQGVMNPEGRGLTQAGKIIGIIGLVINGGGIILNIVFSLLGAAINGPNF